MHAKLMTVVISFLVISSGGAHAEEPRSDMPSRRGEHVARMVCSACHIVADDQEFQMPSPMLLSTDADDLARYLMSLRKP